MNIKMAGVAALISACVAAGAAYKVTDWYWSAKHTKLQRDIAEAGAKAVEQSRLIEQLQQEKTSAVSAKFAAEEIARNAKAKTITKKVIEYVQSPDAGECHLSDDWVRIHNDSTGQVPSTTEAPSGANDTPREPKTDVDALVTVTENYAICLANAAKLKALQEWASIEVEQ